MKYAISTAIATAFALAASSAMAQSRDANDSGFYAGAGIGQFNVNADSTDQADEIIKSLDDDGNSWKGFVGWRFNPYIALELAYIDFGKVRGTFGPAPSSTTANGANGDYDLSISGFAPYVIGTIPLGPVELFGKAGYYFYDSKVSFNFDNPVHEDIANSSTSEEDFVYGAGVGVTFFQHLNARLEYERIDAKNLKDADAAWLSASWRF